MGRLDGLLNTSIGQKLALAASGVALIGFLLVHLLGNLTLFQGPEVMNAYAHWMQTHPLLWAGRVGLVTLFGLHTTLAIRLALENHRARPIRYAAGLRSQDSTFLSRYIVLTGLLVLAFLVYHLLHFTVGAVQPEHARLLDEQGRHDVYGMVVRSFGEPAVAISYLVAMTILGLHLFHGLRSLSQTFGVNHETYVGAIRWAAGGLALAIVVGNASIPLSVWLGWISL